MDAPTPTQPVIPSPFRCPGLLAPFFDQSCSEVPFLSLAFAVLLLPLLEPGPAAALRLRDQPGQMIMGE